MGTDSGGYGVWGLLGTHPLTVGERQGLQLALRFSGTAEWKKKLTISLKDKTITQANVRGLRYILGRVQLI